LKTPKLLSVGFVSMAFLASCGERRGPAPKPAAARVKVLATVNGVPITEHDVNQRSRMAVTGGGPAHDLSGNVLETVVRDELISQKAVQLGLDQDLGYRQRVDDLEAQLRAFKRQELSALYRSYVQEHAAVTDAEAQAFFERNAGFLQTKLHVLQIFYKGQSTDVLKDREDVRSGMPFEEVAARRFTSLPANMKPPWDLGELRWNQLPPSWRGIVDRLEPGQVSDVIKGENDRYWVIKLAGKTTDPAITFATEKERIVEVLRQQKAAELHDAMLADMKGRSSITYSK
jgi:parvulin-like peptidyl-prolyl isomerase